MATTPKSDAVSFAAAALRADWPTGLPDSKGVRAFLEEQRVYTLSNARGTRAKIIRTGATLVGLEVADRDGKIEDVLLGFDSEAGYQGPHPYFGSIVGRYANRIRGGRFRLDGREYALPVNDGPNHLHGGPGGFHARRWDADPDSERAIRFRYVSADGEEGFPGRLDVTVVYSLNDNDELRIEYLATTDAPTIVNLTNHAYFNLAGHGSGSVLDHVARIDANAFTPVDATLIPTGEIRAVLGSALDFSRPKPIGEHLGDSDEQLRLGLGYDHNFVLDKPSAGALAVAARVAEPKSGRALEVSTTEPGIQFYTGNHLDGIVGKAGRRYDKRSGFCLEAQHYPDSPNQSTFPSVVLRPGEVYRQTTIYRVSSL